VINSNDRVLAADLIEQLFGGQITNFEFMKRYPAPAADAAMVGIYRGLWSCWDEKRERTLTGDHSPSTTEQILAKRCVRFLRSNLEYRWPVRINDASPLLVLLRALQLRKAAERRFQREIEQARTHGDFSVWPFQNRSDYLRFGGDLADIEGSGHVNQAGQQANTIDGSV